MHLPPYLVDRGLDVSWGGWVLAFIGLFNIIGAISAGLLGSRFPKRYLLSIIYSLRAVAIAAFVLAPMSPRERARCSGPPWASCGSRRFR